MSDLRPPGRYRRAARWLARYVGETVATCDLAEAIGVPSRELGPVLRWHRLAGRIEHVSHGVWRVLTR